MQFNHCSNASAFRRHPQVPLVVPFVNAEHMQILHHQQLRDSFDDGHQQLDATATRPRGFLVTNANCSTTGLVVVLKALMQAHGALQSVLVTSLQAISGAGFTGLAAMEIMDNVVPFIGGEEDKLEWEPRKILGSLSTDKHSIQLHDMVLSAQCNRVPVIDGHTLCVSIKFADADAVPSLEQVLQTLSSFVPPDPLSHLPSMRSVRALQVLSQDNRPQPRLDRDRGQGLTVSVGRVRPCPINHFRFVVLSHNTVLGAAGSSLLNAEYAARTSLFDAHMAQQQQQV
jgi:aspartate-semialdehyde dehydrogenase